MRWLMELIRRLFGCAPPLAPETFDPAKSGYSLFFSDEFGPGVDWSKWDWREPWSGTEDTRKGIVVWRRDNAVNTHPGVRLMATRAPGSPNDECGLISSHRFMEFLYGVVRVMAKIPPRGFTYFPAIWMYDKRGWLPEIDVMEAMGPDSTSVGFTHHWDDDGTHRSEGTTAYNLGDLSAGYHEYAVEWNAGSITWYVDGVKKYTALKNVPQVPLFLICNIQAGPATDGGSAFTRLFSPSEVPMGFDVRRVEVWKK